MDASGARQVQQEQTTALAEDEPLPPIAPAKAITTVDVEDDTSDQGLTTKGGKTGVDEADTELVRGAVIIKDGNDVARYVVSTQDDHDPALTFRSFIIGSGLTALAACINQIYFYKPVDVSFASVFLCLMAYVIGLAWSKALPRREHVHKFLPRQAAWVGPVVHFINPGHFGLKEHAVASILSTSSGNGAAIVQVFGAERLFYGRETSAATAILTIFSASVFGYGLVGLLRSVIVHREYTSLSSRSHKLIVI